MLVPVVLMLAVVAAVSLLVSIEGATNTATLARELEPKQAALLAEAGYSEAKWRLAQNTTCTGYADIPVTAFGVGSYSATVTPTSDSPVTLTATGTLPSGAQHALNRDAIRVHQASNTLDLQLGTDPGEDTILDSFYPRNYGGATYLKVSGDPSWRLRTLLKFDLAGIPPASVFSARLELRMWSLGAPGTATVHQVRRSWVEGTKNGGGIADGATWATHDGTSNWTSAGGDFNASPVAETAIGGGETWISWEIAPLVERWLAGEPNYGLLIAGNNGLEAAEFASQGNSDASVHPKLAITYACECGQTCLPAASETFCEADYTPNVVQDEFSSSAIDAPSVQAITYVPEGIVFNGVTSPVGGSWMLIDPGRQRFYMTSMAGALLTTLPIPVSSVHGGVFISSGIYAEHLALTNTSGGLVYVNMDGVNVSGTLASGSSQAAGIGFVGTSSTGTYDDHILVLDRSSETVLIRTQAGAAVSSFSVNDATSSPVQDVKHLPGTDKVIVTYDPARAAIYDFGGTLLRDYDLSGFGVTLAESTAINPLTCEHVVADRGSDRVITLSEAASCNADYTPDNIAFEFSTASYPQRLNRGVTYFPEGQVLNGVTSPAAGAWIAVGGSGILWMVGMDGAELDGGYATGLSQLEGIAFVPADPATDPGHLAIVENSTLYYSDMSLPAGGSYTSHSLPFASGVKGITYIDGGTYDGHLAIADHNTALIHIIDGSFNLVTTLNTGALLNAPEGIAHLRDTDKFLVVDTVLNAALVIDTGLVVHQNYALDPYGLGGASGAAAAIHPTSCDHVFGDRPNDRYAYLNVAGPGPAKGADAAAATGTGGTFRDEFNTVGGYAGDDGTLTWASDWLEVGESDGASSGDEQVLSGNVARVRDNDGGGEGIQREADLAGYTSATLTFIYYRGNLDDANDYVTIEVSDNGGSTWVELGSIEGPGSDPDTDPQSASYDISAYRAPNTRIRFRTSPTMGPNDGVYLDNVQIQVD
jgi:hypothetical protein